MIKYVLIAFIGVITPGMCSIDRPYSAFDLDERLLPMTIFVPITRPVEEPLKRAPSAEDLPDQVWQEIFYDRHLSGQQHILICASNHSLFETYLDALMRLLVVNPLCRITIVAKPQEHELLRAQVKALIIEKIRPNSDILRNLHFLDLPFMDGEPNNKVVRAPLNRDRYTGILLARPRGDYTAIRDWLHNQKSMLYIPYDWAPERICTKLYEAGFRSHEVLTTADMICAATSDHATFPKNPLLSHPDNVKTPKISRMPSEHNQCPQCGCGKE